MPKILIPEEKKILIVTRKGNKDELYKLIKSYLSTLKGNIQVHNAATEDDIRDKTFGHNFDRIIVLSENDRDLVGKIKNKDNITFIKNRDDFKKEVGRVISEHTGISEKEF